VDESRVKIIYRAAHKATSMFARALVKQSGAIDGAIWSLTSSANYKGLVILDQACGTGAVTEALYDTFKSTHGQQGARPDWHLKYTNLSPLMLEAMEELAKSRNWANVDVAKSDILNNGLAAQSFDYVFACSSTYHAVFFTFSGPEVGNIIGSELDLLITSINGGA
jgi:SAM-dependent methyltransferase